MDNINRQTSEEFNRILDGLVENLTIDDIMYIIMHKMVKEDIPYLNGFGASKTEDLQFKLTAEITKGDSDEGECCV